MTQKRVSGHAGSIHTRPARASRRFPWKPGRQRHEARRTPAGRARGKDPAPGNEGSFNGGSACALIPDLVTSFQTLGTVRLNKSGIGEFPVPLSRLRPHEHVDVIVYPCDYTDIRESHHLPPARAATWASRN
jgi:hypothetical protein